MPKMLTAEELKELLDTDNFASCYNATSCENQELIENLRIALTAALKVVEAAKKVFPPLPDIPENTPAHLRPQPKFKAFMDALEPFQGGE
jgi:hypothetical protein